MGAFTEQMEALTRNLFAASADRAEAVARMRRSTADLLAEARNSLEDIATRHRALSQGLERDLRGATSRLTAQMEAFLDELDQARAQRIAELSELLKDGGQERSRQVAALLDGFARSRLELARHLAEAVGGFAERLAWEVGQFVGHAHAARDQAAQSRREQLRAGLTQLRDQVASLAQAATDAVGRCREARRDMAHELHSALACHGDERRRAVRELLEGFRSTQQTIADDLRAAAQRWQDLCSGQRDCAASLAAKEPPAKAATSPARAQPARRRTASKSRSSRRTPKGRKRTRNSGRPKSHTGTTCKKKGPAKRKAAE